MKQQQNYFVILSEFTKSNQRDDASHIFKGNCNCFEFDTLLCLTFI